MKKTKLIALLLILSMLINVFLFSSCSSNVSKGENYDNKEVIDEQPRDNDSESEINLYSASAPSDRKIIITSIYTIETKNFGESVKQITEKTNELGGYIQSSDIRNGSETYESSYASFELRIPADKLYGFINSVEGFGNITYTSQTGKDVTVFYYDLENEITSLKIQQERVINILEKAQTLSEVLQIEKELTEIRTKIESLTTERNKLSNLIDYATVKITLKEVRTFTDVNDKSFINKASEAFKDSFNTAFIILKNLVISLIWILPYLITAAVILLIIIAIKKRKKKKIKNLLNNSTQKKEE